MSSIITGCLLSDMSIEKTSSVSARLCQANKYKEFLTFLSFILNMDNIPEGDISSYITSKKSIIKSRPQYFKYRSKSLNGLLSLHEKWYPNGKKIIPVDIKINPITMLFMYLGDGSLISNNNRLTKSPSIILYTNLFHS